MGEATGLAKGLERQFGVEPDVDICGKRGVTLVLAAPAELDARTTAETIDRATFTLKAFQVRVRGRVEEQDGVALLVVGSTGQRLEILSPDLAKGLVGRDLEVVASITFLKDSRPGIESIEAASTDAPIGLSR